MPQQFSNLTFTPSVKDVQTEMGSRDAGEMLIQRDAANDLLGPSEKHFISLRDGFYMATVGETDWPYIQFRGGPPGFLQSVDDHNLAFADVLGNRQYISVGNLRANQRVAIFLMDYPSQSRLRVHGQAEVIPWNDAPEWKNTLILPPKATPERVVYIHVTAFDWACPKYIPQRWTAEEHSHRQALEAESRDPRASLAAALLKP